MDDMNAMLDYITRAAKVDLQTISDPTTRHKEIGTNAYILLKLFGQTYPLMEGYTSVLSSIDGNFDSFEHQVHSTALCTSFSYNLSRVDATYYKACIYPYTTALMGDLGAQIPIYFQILLNKLTWGRYCGQTLPLIIPASNRGHNTQHAYR